MNRPGVLKKVPIGALQPGVKDIIVVAVIINKPDPRAITMKKDGTERWVACLTLRDSPADLINLTIWSGREEADEINNRFHIGDIVEIIKPRIQQREFNSSSDKYSPAVTSPLHLYHVEGTTVISHHLGSDSTNLKLLLRIPTKASSRFLKISDILSMSAQGSTIGHHVDLLVAVRSVNPVKQYKKNQQEKYMREVKLFDQTSDSVTLKMWDLELVAMSDRWIPRQDILHLADVRIDWDQWRGSTVVTCTSRTILTCNPHTQEAATLVTYAQTVDFSSISKLDQFVSTIDIRSISRILNVANLAFSCEEVCTDRDSILTTLLYGYITKFDLDVDGAVCFHCNLCNEKLSQKEGDQKCCGNLDCSNYNSVGTKANLQYNVRADVSDETGTMARCRVNNLLLERFLGPATDFINLSAATKTGFKWQFFLRPLKLSLVVMKPTREKQSTSVVIVDFSQVTLAEITTKMPSPTVK